MLAGGTWRGREIVPQGYLDALASPCPIKPDYGFLWWLNTGRELFPAAPETSLFAIGAGGNTLWVEPAHDLVVVARWLDDAHANDFMARIMAAIDCR